MSGKKLRKITTKYKPPAKAVLAAYRYEGNTAVGTYVQDETPILQEAYESRQKEDVRQKITDLDMGMRFATIPRVIWLEIQALGIDQDPNAIINYLNIKKANNPDENYFTTNRRLT